MEHIAKRKSNLTILEQIRLPFTDYIPNAMRLALCACCERSELTTDKKSPLPVGLTGGFGLRGLYKRLLFFFIIHSVYHQGISHQLPEVLHLNIHKVVLLPETLHDLVTAVVARRYE